MYSVVFDKTKPECKEQIPSEYLIVQYYIIEVLNYNNCNSTCKEVRGVYWNHCVRLCPGLLLSGQYLHKTSELSTFCNQTWYGGCVTMSRSIMRNKKVCCLQVQGHSYDSNNQKFNVTVL